MPELPEKAFSRRAREEMLLQMAVNTEKILVSEETSVGPDQLQVHEPLVKIAGIGEIDILAFI